MESQIVEAFLISPFWFVLGCIILTIVFTYKKIMLFFYRKKNFLASKEGDYSYTTGACEKQALFIKENTMEKSIKELSEVIVAVDAIIYDCIKSLKGEGSPQEKVAKLFSMIVADKELHAKVLLAFENYKEIPEEVKDLDAEETLALVAIMLPLIAKYFKKSV